MSASLIRLLLRASCLSYLFSLFDLLMSTTHPPAMLANVENSPLREIMNTAAAADDDGDDREDASYYGDVNNAGRQHGRRPPQHHQQRSMRERCGVAADPSSALSTNRLGDGGAALEDWRWTQQHLGDEARVEETLEQCNSPRLATLIRAAIVADDAEASKHAVQVEEALTLVTVFSRLDIDRKSVV